MLCQVQLSWKLACLAFWGYLLLCNSSGRETIQKAWRQEEITALLAGFLCLKSSRKSSVEGRKTEMSVGKIILLTKTSAELLVLLLLELRFGSSQYEGLADKELTGDLKIRLNWECKHKQRQEGIWKFINCSELCNSTNLILSGLVLYILRDLGIFFFFLLLSVSKTGYLCCIW